MKTFYLSSKQVIILFKIKYLNNQNNTKKNFTLHPIFYNKSLSIEFKEKSEPIFMIEDLKNFCQRTV